MNRSDCKALRSAAYELQCWADIIQEQRRNPTTGEWDEGAKAWHDKHIRLANRLRSLANAEQAKLPL